MFHGRSPWAFAACAVTLALPASAPAADTLYAVTDDNEIITLNSSVPGNVERSIAISGLQPGETIVGIDVRPADDSVVALGSTSRVYQINPVTGALVTIDDNSPFTPALLGNSFGFDVNPTVDRLRVVSDLEQNLRLHPGTGEVVAVDGSLAYAPGDAGAGANPAVASVAYTNSTRGATSTTLYAIDSARDVLVTQDPPNSGTLNTVGALGVDASEPVAFDITSENVGYAAFRRAGQSGAELFAVNLQTGRVTQTAKRSVIGTKPIRALAAADPVSNDSAAPALSVAFSSTQLEDRLLRDGVAFTGNCNEDCTIDARVTINGRTAGTSNGQRIAGHAGLRTVRIALDPGARAQIRRPGNVLMRLSIGAEDSAGNRASQLRLSRTQTLAQRRGG